jgi:hypothetical protein
MIALVLALVIGVFCPIDEKELSQDKEFLVVVSDFNCKACHKDVLHIFNSVKKNSKVRLKVCLVTEEMLTVNINRRSEELSNIYKIKTSEVIVYKPKDFLAVYPNTQEHLARSPFVLLKKKENTLVISQKDLSTEGETKRIVEEIKNFYK